MGQTWASTFWRWPVSGEDGSHVENMTDDPRSVSWATSFRFDKRMITISRADYMSTKVNLLPFVTDGALVDMSTTADALIRELRAMVAEHPPKSDTVQQRSDPKANLGFSEEQLIQAMKAIEQDDDTTLEAIVNAKVKECPEIKSVLSAAAQSDRMGHVSNFSCLMLK